MCEYNPRSVTALQFVHVACVASYLMIAGYVMRRAPHLQRSAGVAALASCFAVWSASLVLAHDPDSTRRQAELAYNLGVVGWSSFGSFAVAFALAFAGDGKQLARPVVRAALIGPPALVMVAQWTGVLAADYIHESWGWAYVWSSSPATWLFYAYYASYVAFALAIIYRAGRATGDRVIRRQSNLIVATATVPLVCATTTDVVLVWLDRHHDVPNIAPAFLLVWVLGVTIAIARFRLLDLTPETVAAEILAAMHDGILLVGPDDRVITYNPAVARLLGDRDPRTRTLHDVLSQPIAPGEMVELETVAGRTVAVSLTALVDGGGGICLLRDVTEEKRAARELQAINAELERRVHERTHELDATSRELQRAVRRLGALQATVDAIHRADDAAAIAAGLTRSLLPTLGLGGGCRIILDDEVYTSPGFEPLEAPLRFEVIAGGNPRGTLELHVAAEILAEERDVVARIATEIGQTLEGLAIRNAIAQADRLASIGVLAAGVAHEINNPLTYVTAGLQEIERMELDHVPQGPEIRERVAEALDGSLRIARIVRELGGFARDADEMRPVPIAEAIDAAVAMANHQIRHRARLEVIHGSTAVVRADPGRLTQVFLNLLVNAAHAIPEGHAEDDQVEISSREDNLSVIVAVRDTGRGIEPVVLAHIFEPFYSTKAAGEGSGLGLAISHKIVRAVGGTITAKSTVGKGSTFEVRLPRTVARTSEPDAATSQAHSGRRLRILIVDDDALVARSLGRILSEHDVDLADSGAAAQRAIESTRYDLVICDLMMPDLHGAELHTWVAERHPAIADRMVFMTGGAFTLETAAFLEEHPDRLISKPFEVDAIHETIDRILARTG